MYVDLALFRFFFKWGQLTRLWDCWDRDGSPAEDSSNPPTINAKHGDHHQRAMHDYTESKSSMLCSI